MVPLLSLWLPVLVSAVFVFVASSILHMALRYHNSDFKRLPHEEGILEHLSKLDLPPGEYVFPWSDCGKDLGKADFKAKLERGPAGFLTVFPRGPLGMGKSLALWFFYCLVIGVFSGYIASRALPAGAPFLQVVRFAGCMAFSGYSLALVQSSIWYRRPWPITVKTVLDGLVYALITGATFGWLWPA